MKPGFFIVFEGPDRSGKTTQANLLKSWLERKGFCVALTREPGGTKLSESIRKILLNPENKIIPLSELLLYEAARAQHTIEVILPALKRGKIVISDRYTLASVAYQGYGRGIPLNLVHNLNKIATFGLTPALTIVFTMPDREFFSRSAKFKSDRIESESSGFRRKVNKAYTGCAGKNIVKIKATDPIKKIHEQVKFHVIKKLQFT
ncbi:MAG: dTMP kinase [Elusimicrobia bacterium]|nr:dTMP kinase [Elusimicrobiota bacterium]